MQTMWCRATSATAGTFPPWASLQPKKNISKECLSKNVKKIKIVQHTAWTLSSSSFSCNMVCMSSNFLKSLNLSTSSSMISSLFRLLSMSYYSQNHPTQVYNGQLSSKKPTQSSITPTRTWFLGISPKVWTISPTPFQSSKISNKTSWMKTSQRSKDSMMIVSSWDALYQQHREQEFKNLWRWMNRSVDFFILMPTQSSISWIWMLAISNTSIWSESEILGAIVSGFLIGVITLLTTIPNTKS